jgi:hypothetical protein
VVVLEVVVVMAATADLVVITVLVHMAEAMVAVAVDQAV